MSPESAAPRIQTAWLSAAAYAGMFGFGIVMALLGAILPLLSRRIGFELDQAGDLFLAMNGAMLVTSFALGPLLDRFGLKPALITAPLFVAAALALIGRAAVFDSLVAAVVLLGIGGGALNQSTNTLVADLHENESRKSAALNRLGVFFGFGALFIPFTIGLLLDVIVLWLILYVAMALVLITTAISVAFTLPAPRQSAGVSFGDVLRLGRDPLLLTLALLLFFESGNEFVLGGYITTFLTRTLGASVPAASYLLAAYWGSLMALRALLGRAMLQISSHVLVLASALIVASSVALLLASSIAVAAAAVILLGAGTAAIFPATLAFAGSRYASHSGTVFGILMGVALTGGMTIPWLAGRISTGRSIAFGLRIGIIDALCIFILQLTAGRLRYHSE